MPVTKGIKELLAEANAVVRTVPTAEAVGLHGQEGVTFVDLRDPRELERDGMIPGAFHAPRGMLEFWVDPESPYFKPVFEQQPNKRFILYCAADWRAVLSAATLSEMGLANVYHLEGGFGTWKKAGRPAAEKSATVQPHNKS